MASPDVQIVRDGPTAVPLNYTLPQSAGLQPLAVNAVFGGAAASGDYLPCVVIIGASGTVIARSAADSTVTAGDDAEVSWFPGVKNSAAGFTKARLIQSFISQATNTTHVIPSGAATTIPMDIFTQAPGYTPGVFVHTGLPSGQLTFADFGTIVSTLMVSWPAGAYDRYIEITVANSDLAEYVKSPRVRTGATPDGDLLTVTAMIEGGPSAPATTITATAFQASGSNKSVSAVWYNKATSGLITLS